MGRKNRRSFNAKEAIKFLNQVLEKKPFLPFVILLFLVVWGIEKWFFSLSNWVPLAIALWAALQYGSHQRHILVEDLNKKWMQTLLQNSQTTPLEQCEWLNKLLLEIWENYIGQRLSLKLSYIVERRLKHRKPRFIEKLELQEFSLGARPPLLGLGIHGARWSTAGDQRILHMGIDWDTTDIRAVLLAKLGKTLMGTTRIVINSLHIKGDDRYSTYILKEKYEMASIVRVDAIHVLDGRALLYSFESTPEVRIGVAFGGNQSQPATEVPGVRAWLDKLATDSIAKRMVEPRRNCLSLPVVNLMKKAVGGVLTVKVISGSKLSRSNIRGSPSRKQQSSVKVGPVDNHLDYIDLRTFVEVELEDLTRRTDMRYVEDDSTIFWATGADFSAIARRAEFCGKEVEMTVPFEGINSGELTVKLILKEWQFSDGSHSSGLSDIVSQQSISGSSNLLQRTGRKIHVTIIDGKNLPTKDRFGMSGSGTYVKLQYGKASKRTRTVPHTSAPEWKQKFEFDEVGGDEYLKIKCFIEETISDENIGSARISLEGLVEGSPRVVWIPLEKVSSGELQLQIEAVRVDDYDRSKRNGWIELALVEAKDLIAADLNGTSDPYVRVQYGNLKKRTKVMYKTLNPQWHQTLEFPDDGSDLSLHVKDHNALLPTSSIGDCIVEYQRLPRNQMFDKWIPLQGVTKGEIHIQITRKDPHLEKKSSLDSEPSVTKARHSISNQMKQLIIKLQSFIEDDDLEGFSASLNELESLHQAQEEMMLQLETEQNLLLSKVNELGLEILNSSSPNLARRTTSL
nr:synaptotagmin-5-like [Ipomoea trifida]